MMMLAVYAAVAALAVYIGVASLNSARVRLRRLGLPLTFKNVFFLSAHEVEAREEAVEKERLEAETTWAREIAGPELLTEMAQRVAQGETWKEAANKVLLQGKPKDAPERLEERLRMLRQRRQENTE